MSITIDPQAPPGAAEDAFEAEVLERLRGMEVTAVRLARERDAARTEARKARLEADAQFRVNLELQRHLNEYNADRRAYEHRIADLEAERDLLRAAVAGRAEAPRRGRWRR